MRRSTVTFSILFGALALAAAPAAHAEAGLQLNPLKYEETLSTGTPRGGIIDVANPGDTPVTIRTSVQGFKQVDLDGNLAFFHDETLSAGIRPGLEEFELGPREALRMSFSVDPAKLPQGGVYAAIFFQTVPPPGGSNISYIAESANLGTLLILQNGKAGAHVGEISAFRPPFWQLGSHLRAEVQYRNGDRNAHGVAFTPKLTTRVFPWGKGVGITGPFIMPDSTRRFTVERRGSYLGLLPLTVRDDETGRSVTRLVFACTGWYFKALIVMGLWLTAEIIFWLVQRWRRGRRKPAPIRALDGLSRAKH